MRTNLDNDTYSANLVVDLLSSIRFDAKFDEDGVFDKEATYAADRGADKPV